MKKFTFYIITLLLFISVQYKVSAQADTLIKFCTQNLSSEYISDGQQYIAFLNGDEIAEFRITFYGNSTYRIAACSGLTQGNLIFTVYDRERNELFSNRNYKNAPYWDFKFTSTMQCIIEAQLDPKGQQSGMAILLVGFKK